MAGIKELWGLKDPVGQAAASLPLGQSTQAAQQREAFQRSMTAANATLGKLAADAKKAALEQASLRREKAYELYHRALSGDGELNEALQAARQLEQQASELQASTRSARQQWESREKLLNATQDALASVGQEREQQAIEARQMLAQAVGAANERDYEVASTALVDAAKFTKQISSPGAGTQATSPTSASLPSTIAGGVAENGRQPSHRDVLKDLFETSLSEGSAGDRQLVYDRLTKHPASDAKAFVDSLTTETIQEATVMAEEMQHALQHSVKDLTQTTAAASDAVKEKVQAANEKLDALSAKARELQVDAPQVDDAQKEISGRLQRVDTQLTEWEASEAGAIASAGTEVDASLQEFEQWAGAMGAALDKKMGVWAELSAPQLHEKLVEAAQGKDLQETLRRGIDRLAETKRGVSAAVESTTREIEAAKARAEQFYDDAKKMAKAGASGAVEQLAGVKDDLIGKLDETQEQARESAHSVERRIDLAAKDLSQSAQEILDTTAGVVDSLADVVDSGTDTLSNAMGSATDFAADRFNSMLNLLS